MADFFEDHRGTIRDIFGPVDAITQIFTKAGCIRGNHVHEKTDQFTYVVSGKLAGYIRDENGKDHGAIYTRGCILHEPAGFAHAWRAEEDTLVLVFTRGPRSGDAYESDTRRLDDEELILRG